MSVGIATGMIAGLTFLPPVEVLGRWNLLAKNQRRRNRDAGLGGTEVKTS